MASPTGRGLSLPLDAGAAVWRIFGQGAAPRAKRLTYEQIEPVIREHVPSGDQDRAFTTVRSWFELGGPTPSLKRECRELVADLILDGVGPRRSDTAVWAIGSIEPHLSVDRIRRQWSSGDIESFIAAAIRALNGTSRTRPRTSGASADVDHEDESGFPRAVLQSGLVGAFARLDEEGLESLNEGLSPTIRNLIELAVELSPDSFVFVVAGLQAPAMQLKAARHRGSLRAWEDGTPLSWITDRSCDAAIALAILQTLKVVRTIDETGTAPVSAASPERLPNSHPTPESEGFGDAAQDLLLRLVERLGSLAPPVCLRWIRELLTHAPRTLPATSDGEKPLPLLRLEEECTKLTAGLFLKRWSADLLSQFRSELRPARHGSWVRHRAAVAWEVRKVSPERSAELAQIILDEHRRPVAEPHPARYVPGDWGDWNHRDWLEGLGTALALFREDLDLPAWVTTECRSLPLSVWDAEADLDAFAAAEQTVQYWFLVALLAVSRRAELHQPIPPSAVRALAEALWEHCRFCQQHLDSHPEASFAAELAARYAMEFGDADDQWILDQVQSTGVGPRALWALLEEPRGRSRQPLAAKPDYDEVIVGELTRVAFDRFRDGGQFDLENLEFWGRLWLTLGAVDQAERTAIAIAGFPLRATDRKLRILALKLYCLVVRHRKPSRRVDPNVARFYNQLWPVSSGTPSGERTDRLEIDEALTGSGLLRP